MAVVGGFIKIVVDMAEIFSQFDASAAAISPPPGQGINMFKNQIQAWASETIEEMGLGTNQKPTG